MLFVRDILRSKPGSVWTIEPRATVFRALEFMAEKNVGALPVVADGALVGIFSERDAARRVILHGKSSHGTAVAEVMSESVISVAPDTSMERCMDLMTDERVRHLPVIDNGCLVGIVSIGDVLKAQIADRDVRIRDMENYIAGSYVNHENRTTANG